MLARGQKLTDLRDVTQTLASRSLDFDQGSMKFEAFFGCVAAGYLHGYYEDTLCIIFLAYFRVLIIKDIYTLGKRRTDLQ